MKRRGVGRNSPVICFIGRVYKGLSHKVSELVARFSGTRDESYCIVVYEKEVVVI